MTTYAAARATTTNVTFAATSGGSLTGSGTLYFCIQARTRQGYNLLSTPQSVAYTAGQKITCTIASGARTAGEEIHEYVVSAATTNSTAAMVRVASVRALQSDQVTNISLPLTIEFTRDAHLALSTTVANLAALPSGSDRLEGMVRFVTSESKYAVYRPNAIAGLIASSPGYWVEHLNWVGASNGFTQYIAATDGAGGCDRDIQSVPTAEIIAPPTYAGDGTDGTPVKLLYMNGLTEDAGAEIQAGVTLSVVISEGNRILSSRFSTYLHATFLGLYRRSTGALDTSSSLVGVPVPVEMAVDADSISTSNLTLPVAIPRGYGALYSFYLNFSPSQIVSEIEGEDIGIYFYPQPRAGQADSSVRSLGSMVLPEYDRLRIVPSLAGVRRLAGTAGIKSSNDSGYTYSDPVAREYSTGLVSNTAGQKIAISATTGLDCRILPAATALQPVEALRAIVSTETGVSPATNWSSAVTVSGSQSVAITITHPSNGTTATVRSTYPDTSIAGNTKATLNAPQLSIYLRLNGTTVRRFNAAVVDGASQVVTISNWGSNVDTATPSTSTATDFSLFMPTAGAIATSVTAGNIPAGNVEVSVAYEYTGLQVTKITHDTAQGCIPVLATTIADAVAAAKGYTTTTANFTQPAVSGTVTVSVATSEFFGIGQYVFVENGGVYTVSSKPSTTQLVLTNTGTGGNAAPTSTIASSSKVTPSGTAGVDGVPGFGIRFNFSTTTTSPPSSGEIRFNNASYSSTTELYVSESSRTAVGVSGLLGAIANGSLLMVFDESDEAAYAFYSLTSQTDNGSDRTFVVTHVGSNGSLSGKVTLAFALKGSTGDTGQPGDGIRYTFSNTTTSGPSSGQIRLNNASPGSTTNIYAHETDRNGVGLASLLGAVTSNCYVILVKESGTLAYAYYSVTSNTDNGSDRTLAVTYVGGTGSFANGDAVVLQLVLRGSTGATGAAGTAAGLKFTFDTGTGSGPASGELRFNNATISSASNIYVSETDRNAVGISAVLAQIPNGSLLQVSADNDSTKNSFFTLTSQTDNGSDRTLAVTHRAGSPTFADADAVSLNFFLKGDTGATGSVSATSALVLQEQVSDPTVSANEMDVYNKNNVPFLRKESSGAIEQIATHAADSWKYFLFYG